MLPLTVWVSVVLDGVLPYDTALCYKAIVKMTIDVITMVINTDLCADDYTGKQNCYN